ncbi:MAG: hypothetical protein NZ699_14215 [Roseiflexus sp.]|nr:hypothetical protein [Roseiflexus sp.]MCS7290281.1 hypothetical protein [Roseiflexus sp.]MDW8146035.1 hypothetical protein [Roseiflexaceae bacterium]MDW8231303.1 hypothetical protein [Roseiflexaceae bacterium]
MNFAHNTRRSAAIGASLIILGFIWWLNLWWLLLPGALIAGGVAAYIQRRAMRVSEAVQIGLWGVGLGLLLLIDFLFPGVLFLAGISILARGREREIDAQVQRFVSSLHRLRSTPRSPETTSVPITVHSGDAPHPSRDCPTTSETTQL